MKVCIGICIILVEIIILISMNKLKVKRIRAAANIFFNYFSHRKYCNEGEKTL